MPIKTKKIAHAVGKVRPILSIFFCPTEPKNVISSAPCLCNWLTVCLVSNKGSSKDLEGPSQTTTINNGKQGNEINKKGAPLLEGNTTADFVRPDLRKEIAKKVLRQKLAKLKHVVFQEAFSPEYLDSLFPTMLEHFDPQTVVYNGGIANIKEWKISCYLEVMDGGVPTTNPNTKLLGLFQPLLDECNDLFLYWYKQKSACNNKSSKDKDISCSRLMTFITRYTPAPGEQALLKVCRFESI